MPPKTADEYRKQALEHIRLANQLLDLADIAAQNEKNDALHYTTFIASDYLD